MTKLPESDAMAERDRPEEIDVTLEMTSAGLIELREHAIAGDLRYMLGCVYRAMAYRDPSRK